MRGASGEPDVIDKADMRPPAGERTKLRRDAAAVRIQYRAGSGEAIDTTLDRVKLDELTKGLPVREFRAGIEAACTTRAGIGHRLQTAWWLTRVVWS